MKKSLLVLSIVMLAMACNKEKGSGEKQVLLTEIRVDGVVHLKFEYDNKNRVSRLESFKMDPVDNSMVSYIVFAHNGNDQINQITYYSMPGNIPQVKAILEYNDENRLDTALSYDLASVTPNTAKYVTIYKYNNAGRVTNIQQKDKSGNLLLYRNLLYYADGHLKESQSWDDAGGILKMTEKISFSIPSGYYPSGLSQLEILLSSEFIASIYSESIAYLSYSQAGVITQNRSDVMSNREYNEDGSLKRQLVTTKYVLPQQNDKVFIREYAYIIR